MVDNLKTYDFISGAIDNLEYHYRAITRDHDISKLWDNVRVIDGTTEYTSMELVEAYVFRYLKMEGQTYDTPPDDDLPVPTFHRRIVFYPKDKTQSSYQVPDMNWWRHRPLILSDFGRALWVLPYHDLTLTRNHKDTLWALWIAEVDGHKAAGNLPAEAVTHAWGISVGLWPPDPLASRF